MIAADREAAFIPEAGLHREVPMEIYRAWDAVASSDLSNMKRSPAYCAYRRTNPSESTPAQAFGTAAHCAVLEPDQLEKRYALDPESPKGGYPAGWRNTKAYKEAKGELLADGFEPLSRDDFDACRMIRENAARSRVGSKLASVQDGLEISALVHDDAFDVHRKIRPDVLVTRAQMVVDLKLVRDASPNAFARAAYGFGYHRSAAYYLDALRLLGMDFEHYVFLAIFNTPPFEVRAYTFDSDSIDTGRGEYRRLLADFAEAKAARSWHEPSDEIEEIRIPEYGFYNAQETF